MKKVGRNDPCPCGSGKKYKKCCLRKEEEERRAQVFGKQADNSSERESAHVSLSGSATEPITARPPDTVRNPKIEAIDARWEEFEASDYEDRLVLFINTLDEPELMDNDMAFEMLNVIHYETVEHNERHRFDALVNELRQRLPDVYQEGSSYFLDWCIANALMAGRYDDAASMARELAERADEDIDVFDWAVDRLSYHGQLSTLVEMLRIAWPRVRQSTNIVPWGTDELGDQATSFEIFDYIEHCPEPRANDEALQNRLKQYTDIDPDRLTSYLNGITGQTVRHWSMEDFLFDSTSLKKSQRRRLSIDDILQLSVEFLGFLRREEAVPYTKGELARSQIVDYILKRFNGDLEPKKSPLETGMHPRRRKPKKKPRRRVDHLFCPDRVTLDHFLGKLLGFLNPQRYKVAATFELMPAWLSFLESRGLVDEDRRASTISEIYPLKKTLIQVFEEYSEDSTLEQNIQAAWQVIGL